MTTYTVNHTDINVQPITIQEQTVDNSTDIELFGRIEIEYGQDLDENILHLLENFACPEAAGSTIINSHPDYTVNGNTLTKPSNGQIWYNSTRKVLYYWNNTVWAPLGGRGHYNANWGVIADGQQLPKPINPYTGEVYDYPLCIWAVSPTNIPTAFTYMLCTTDSSANVTMKYRASGSNTLTSGTANFLIISIYGNVNAGNVNVTPLTPAVSGTPTPTPSPTHSATITPTPSISISKTPVPSATPTPIASATPSPTPAASLSKTPAPSSTPAPSVTPTPTPFASDCAQCTAIGAICCVAVDSHLPDGKVAGDIRVGDFMMLADEESLEPFTDEVTYSEPSWQDSVRIVTERGAVLDCSKTAPIPTKDKGVITSPNVYGEFVGVMLDGVASWDKVVELREIGEIRVQHITVNNKSFWAGKTKGAYILHHNLKCCYCDGSGNSWVAPNCCVTSTSGCSTCASQCSSHGGGAPSGGGCRCNDGTLLQCL